MLMGYILMIGSRLRMTISGDDLERPEWQEHLFLKDHQVRCSDRVLLDTTYQHLRRCVIWLAVRRVEILVFDVAGDLK